MAVRILVLEDDPDMRDMLVVCLLDEGHQVLEAVSGDEALRLAEGAPPDLVIADVRLRGKDGIETVRLLRTLNPALRAIIITGYASDDAPSRAIQAEAEDYLYKPFGMSDLMTAVQRVLSRKEERSRYHRLLDTCLAGFRRLKERATTAVLDQEWTALDQVRDRAFLNFYVAIRSEGLLAPEGKALWNQLSRLDAEREELKGKALALQEIRELTERYRYTRDLLAAAGQPTSVPLRLSQEVSGPTTDEEFSKLRRNLKEGRLSSEQLKLAPFLKSLDPSLLRQSEDLEKLHQAAWG